MFFVADFCSHLMFLKNAQFFANSCHLYRFLLTIFEARDCKCQKKITNQDISDKNHLKTTSMQLPE